MRDRSVGYASMAVAATTWGSLPVVLTHADGHAVTPVCLRMGFGALGLGLFLAAFGRSDVSPSASRGLVATMGVVLAVNWVMFFTAIQRIGATAVLIGYVFPLIVAVLAPVVLRERREPHVVPLAAVGLVGVATMFWPRVSAGDPVGALLALGVAGTSATLVMAARRVVEDVPGPVVAFWENTIGVALLVPLVVLVDGGGSIPWRWGVLMGLVHTAASGVLFFRAIGRLPAQEAGVLMYLEPVSAVVFVWALVGTAPTTYDVAGGTLVVGAGAGLVVVSAARSRRAPQPV